MATWHLFLGEGENARYVILEARTADGQPLTPQEHHTLLHFIGDAGDRARTKRWATKNAYGFGDPATDPNSEPRLRVSVEASSG